MSEQEVSALLKRCGLRPKPFFEKYMRGKTIGLTSDGSTVYPSGDVYHFIRMYRTLSRKQLWCLFPALSQSAIYRRYRRYLQLLKKPDKTGILTVGDIEKLTDLHPQQIVMLIFA